MFFERPTRSGRRKFRRVYEARQNDGPRPLLSHGKMRHQTRSIETGLGGVQTLNVVIESGVLVTIEIQVFESIVSGEVLVIHVNPRGQPGESHGWSTMYTSNCTSSFGK